LSRFISNSKQQREQRGNLSRRFLSGTIDLDSSL
jgi:hypothetical protein